MRAPFQGSMTDTPACRSPSLCLEEADDPCRRDRLGRRSGGPGSSDQDLCHSAARHSAHGALLGAC